MLLWMLTFGFATMISVKNLKANNGIFLLFYDIKNGHSCYCLNSKGNILQEAPIFLQLLDMPI